MLQTQTHGELSSWKSGIFGFLLLVVGMVQTRLLTFTSSDLGRHIMNGKVTLSEWIIPNINLYSYTEPAFPFVNHHWLSGVFFYLMYEWTGFAGLSAFSAGLHVLTFFLLFEMAYHKGRFDVSMLYGLLVLPLIAMRSEVRPEVFSYLLVAVFFRLMWLRQEGKLSNALLWIFPVLMALWVNLHIYFFFGGIMILGMVLDETAKHWKAHDRWKTLATPYAVLIAGGLATLVNPAGLWGALEPFLIFGNYNYAVSENQTIFVIEDLMRDGTPILFKIAVAVTAIAVFRFFWRQKGKAIWFGGLLPLVAATGLAFMAIRNFALFAYVSLPVVAYLLKDLPTGPLLRSMRLSVLSLCGVLLFIFASSWRYWLYVPTTLGFGLQSDAMDGLNFLKDNNIKGPIFNDYDTGGYLIFGLYPEEKVFTDNRPEAYPAAFFQDLYMPMQADDREWIKADQRFNFNVIVISTVNMMDITQGFIQRRKMDYMWVPVFQDPHVTIFLKNVPQNAAVIKKFSLRKQ